MNINIILPFLREIYLDAIAPTKLSIHVVSRREEIYQQ